MFAVTAGNNICALFGVPTTQDASSLRFITDAWRTKAFQRKLAVADMHYTIQGTGQHESSEQKTWLPQIMAGPRHNPAISQAIGEYPSDGQLR